MKRMLFGFFIAMIALGFSACKGIAVDTTPEPSSTSTITLLAIPGVTAPVRGAVPVTTAIDTAQYTGSISWSPAANLFAANTVYTATIVLTVKDAWSFSGVTANSFLVAGAAATNVANTGIVTAVFPKTADAIADVPLVLSGVAQAGGVSNATTSTSLTLTFSADPVTLTANNITITGATKGALTGSGTTRSIGISDITVADGAMVSVSVASPPGFTISGSPKSAVVYKAMSNDITFFSAAQIGGVSNSVTTTDLLLTFSADPVTLSAGDITLTGATSGALTGSGTTRNLAISGVTVANGATLSVAIANPSGYVISGSPQTVVVYNAAATSIAFLGVTQVGGISNTATTTSLTLSFSMDPGLLTADDITLSGATKGALTGSGTTRNLAISDITIANGAMVSVSVASTAGSTITGSPKTAAVYKTTSTGLLMIKSPPSGSKLVSTLSGSIWRLAYGLGPSLPYNVWTPWEITDTNPVWMGFIAEAGLTYTINWDDSYSGTSNYTADLMVGLFQADKTTRVSGWASDIDSGYSVNKTFSVTETQMVFVKVVPYSSDVGTYAIMVTQASSVNTDLSFSWYLDGSVISGASSYLYNLNTASLTTGVHELVAVGSRDGVTFSDKFAVTK